MMSTHDPLHNQLLSALDEEDDQRWMPFLEPVEMPLGQVLYESGSRLTHVWFPTTAIVSLLCPMENGASTAVAAVGHEGLVGLSAFLGGESTPQRAVVQSAGRGYRIRAQALRDQSRRPAVMNLLLCYTQALMTQTAQTAVCNRHHALTQQLCRTLLHSLDRLPDNEVPMTQELIASLLGVRREGVTESALKLQREGLIRYTRGRISVLDREGLEERACECHSIVKQEYERLLPASASRRASRLRVAVFGGHQAHTAQV